MYMREECIFYHSSFIFISILCDLFGLLTWLFFIDNPLYLNDIQFCKCSVHRMSLGTCKLCRHSFGHNGLNLNARTMLEIFTSRGLADMEALMSTLEFLCINC